MKKSVWQVINESLAGSVETTPVALIDDSRSVFQIVNEGITEVNYLISESALSLSDMNEDLISAVLMNESVEIESLNEGVLKSAGEGIKKFFAMIKRIITSIIDKIKLMVDSHRKNGAQLVATYGSKVKGASTEGVEIKGFKYLSPDKIKAWTASGDDADIADLGKKVDDLGTTLENLLTAEKATDSMEISEYNKAVSSATTEFVKEHLDKLKEDGSDFQEKIVAIVKKVTGEDVSSKTITEVQQELMKIARDGKTSKEVVKAKDYNMDTLMKELSAGIDVAAINRSLDTFKKNVDAAERKFDNQIKNIEKAKDNTSTGTEASKASYVKTNTVSYLNAAKDYLSKLYNVHNAINAVVIKLIEEEYKQKVQIFIAVAKKVKPAKQNNSVEELDELDLLEFEL